MDSIKIRINQKLEKAVKYVEAIISNQLFHEDENSSNNQLLELLLDVCIFHLNARYKGEKIKFGMYELEQFIHRVIDIYKDDPIMTTVINQILGDFLPIINTVENIKNENRTN